MTDTATFRGVPVLGALAALARRDPEVWTDLRLRHGNVFRIILHGEPITVVCHPDGARHVLVDAAERYPDKGGATGFRRSVLTLTGSALSTMDVQDEAWNCRRRVLRPLFAHSDLDAAVTELDRITDATLLAPLDPVGEADVLPLVKEVVLRSLTHQLFGTEPGSAETLIVALDRITSYMWPGVVAARWPRAVPFPGRRGQRTAVAAIDDVITALASRNVPTARGDVVDLLRSHYGGDCAELVRDEAAAMLLGSQPLAMSLAWALRLLSERSDVQRRLVAELSHLDGGSARRLAGQSYLRAVVKESLRLCPPTYWVQRRASQPDMIGEVGIPAGGLVLLQIHQIHRNPDAWAEADTFSPERFLRTATPRSATSWLPFGLGRRTCVAQEYSILQMALVIARVVTRFRLEPVGPRPALEATLNLRPAGPVRIRMVRR
ncbi:cytochrome P450 [Streptomyces sp. NPDC001549]|uniref:cytochrome P450 n=1 Tax=Streptomyces sp. NPDC001549 TaxID=3364586 RepID=UPI0036998943